MRKLIVIFLLSVILPLRVSATEYTAPVAPDEAEKYMPAETNNFGDGLLHIIKQATSELLPEITEAAAVCISLLAVTLLISLVNSFSGSSKQTIELVGAVCIGMLLLRSSQTMIGLGEDTVRSLNDYGKLLLPVMTAALAAQGGVTASAALYTGTVFFSSVLISAITKLLIPMIYIYVCICIANSALQEGLLLKISSFIKWLMTWFLKIILYVFTGYISITGVVNGTADAAALKAAKITISGFIPVIGGIISDASESILVSASIMRSAAGIYGVLAMIAICVGPFIKIGVQYLMLKACAGICGLFGTKKTVSLIGDFSAAMGFVLAMTGAVCLLLIISTVCFMKGIT